MSAVSLIAVPYELDRLRYGVGRGPEHLLECGAAEALGAFEIEVVELSGGFESEAAGCFELIRQVRERVARAIAGGAFPVVLSGSCCHAALGVVAGLGEEAPGVVWFDAHGDFNTPESTTFGYFDGMGLAMLTGDAWQGMLTTVPGARPLPETMVLQAGARDFDEGETARFEGSGIGRVGPAELATRDALARALAELEPEPTGLYLHVDLDVLDAEEAAVNIYSSTGGITGEQLAARVDDVLRTGLVRAVSLTAYDPECDPEGRVPPVAERLLGAVALSARAPAPGAS